MVAAFTTDSPPSSPPEVPLLMESRSSKGMTKGIQPILIQAGEVEPENFFPETEEEVRIEENPMYLEENHLDNSQSSSVDSEGLDGNFPAHDFAGDDFFSQGSPHENTSQTEFSLMTHPTVAVDSVAQAIPSPADLEPDNRLEDIPLPSNPVPSEALPPEPTQTDITPPDPSLPDVPGSETIIPDTETTTLSQINILGSTLFSQEDLQPLLETFQNRPLTQQDIQAISNSITRLYASQGYITSRALPPIITEGVAEIKILEGSIEKINFSGTTRLSQDYIRRRIELGVGTPFNVNQLEEQLRLLRLSPLFEEFDATLRAGEATAASILDVQVKEAPEFTVELNSNNAGAPSVGAERLGIQLQYQNLTGNGDVLRGEYKRSRTGGSQQYNVTYSMPINPMNGTVTASADITRSKITQDEFESLNIRSNTERYSLNYRQPIIRGLREELALSAGFTFQDGQTFLTDNPTATSDSESVSRTSVVQLGQDYLRRDSSGAWSLRSQFKLGTGLLNATNRSGSQPDGQFFSWSGQIQRAQRLNDSQRLIARAELQLSPDPLLSSQQFAVGGRYSVRGYRENRSLGDNGFRASLENYITLTSNSERVPTVQLVPFVEAGKAWNSNQNPQQPRIDTWLAGAGVGLIWRSSPNSQLRVDYGVPLISASDRGDDLQDKGLYFNATYRF